MDTAPAPQKDTTLGHPEINFFASTNFRNQNRKFGIKVDDRRRHMYVVGKTGMGKTTLLENMVLNDIYAGHGVGLVDPHGDFAEKIIEFIPPHRINDVVYFNPADMNYPIGFNILETVNPEHQHLVASGLMGVFKKIWPDVWSARMEYILNNTILALLAYPGTTLLGINRLLADEEYRRRVVSNLKDPVVKAFWQTEFANYTDKFRTEAVAPIQNKIGQFLSASVIRNIVAQVKSRINIREIMDNKKIFIMNLSKGRIGEDNSRLLGGMLITKIQLAAMERVDIPEKQRSDFFLYVDEFQNFANESFANILSEARKYRLDLVMAHQYMEQLEEEVLAAVIGNVGTMLTFRVGSSDAEILAKEFVPTFVEEDLVNLPKYQIYLKLMIDGVASRPFSATTLGPVSIATGSTDKVIRVSRERYAVNREKIEEKIMRWSGMMSMGANDADDLEIDADDIIFNDKLVEAQSAPLVAPVLPAKAVAPPVVVPAVIPVVPRPQPISPPPTILPPPLVRPTAPSVQPMNQPAPRPPSVQPQGGGQNFSAGQPTNNGGIPGSGKKKKRKRNKNKGNLPPPGASGETVLLGDPNQRGISLQQLGGGQQPRQNPPATPRPSAPPQPPIEPVAKENLGFITTPTAPQPPHREPVDSISFSVDYEPAPEPAKPAPAKLVVAQPAPVFTQAQAIPAPIQNFPPEPPRPTQPPATAAPKVISPGKVTKVDA